MSISSTRACPHLSLACLLALTAPHASAEVYYSKRGLFDQSTGYVESLVGGEWYRGSGVIARDPKLIYSCGHVLYENGVWATDYLFYRAYNSRYTPDASTGVSPRGFRYFSNYSDNADTYGPNSARAFAYDFTVFYGTEPFGEAVGWWQDGGAALRSDQLKQIVGYPTSVEYTGERGYCYQYGTDWFTNKAAQTRDAYHTFNNVSTGGGNSGGPVFVKDAGGTGYFLGGILVSGSYSTAGVYALNDSSNSMASAALGIKEVTLTFANTSSVMLPDASSTYVTRKATASGFTDNITGLKFSTSITTPRRGDLDVYLKSPSGRIRWIHKASTETADNIVIKDADYSTKFRGYAANGEWKLRMRDVTARNRATFNSFSVSVSAPGE